MTLNRRAAGRKAASTKKQNLAVANTAAGNLTKEQRENAAAEVMVDETPPP